MIRKLIILAYTGLELFNLPLRHGTPVRPLALTLGVVLPRGVLRLAGVALFRESGGRERRPTGAC